jgi:hypothetical protein
VQVTLLQDAAAKLDKPPFNDYGVHAKSREMKVSFCWEREGKGRGRVGNGSGKFAFGKGDQERGRERGREREREREKEEHARNGKGGIRMYALESYAKTNTLLFTHDTCTRAHVRVRTTNPARARVSRTHAGTACFETLFRVVRRCCESLNLLRVDTSGMPPRNFRE